MSVKFLDLQDENNVLNGTHIESRDFLVKTLSELREREPFLCRLERDNELTIGLGDIGVVQHSGADGEPPYLVAVGAPYMPRNHATSLKFLAGNTATPVPARYGLPFKTVLEIALHFLETGEASPAVLWEEV